ncbi:hypothetical protein [Rhodococcus sp. ACS1]|uniref:hypothetical protein n=1 Tax=Rhodococcus sp. ACS1 TaxID=2028570 RepID=UPI00117BBE62|nr:hypothetical protein [Rhodococcus sp. ACS1]
MADSSGGSHDRLGNSPRQRITELYQDQSAHVVASCGIAYYLTPCLDASGKGSMGSIVCRSCYEEVDSLFALGWSVADDSDWARFRSHMLANYPVSAETVDPMRAAAL